MGRGRLFIHQMDDVRICISHRRNISATNMKRIFKVVCAIKDPLSCTVFLWEEKIISKDLFQR